MARDYLLEIFFSDTEKPRIVFAGDRAKNAWTNLYKAMKDNQPVFLLEDPSHLRGLAINLRQISLMNYEIKDDDNNA